MKDICHAIALFPTLAKADNLWTLCYQSSLEASYTYMNKNHWDY